MKKFSSLIFIVTILLTSCSTTSNSDSIEVDSGDGKQDLLACEISNNDSIKVLSPITLSYNQLDNRILKVRMTEGRYYEDWNPGPFMGGVYEGKFVFEVSDDIGKIIAQTNMKEIHEGENNFFTSDFDIVFDDYNNDGDLDFTIGQYGSSNGNNFKIFTLRQDGKVETLEVENYSYLFISDTSGYYSTQLKKLDNNSFTKQYYDNAKGLSFEDTFRWDGDKFIRTLKKEVCQGDV